MRILLHICCSNCATYPLKLILKEGHDFTGLWFNPNIHPYQEYKLRLDSLKELEDKWGIDVLYIEEYRPEEYFKMFGHDGSATPETTPEAPERCRFCYNLRLDRTAKIAKDRGFDAFTTTLLISPYQDFDQIVATGKELASRYGIGFYYRDFRPYFRDSKTLSRELGLYRQKYCGCIYSKKERDMALKKKKLATHG